MRGFAALLVCGGLVSILGVSSAAGTPSCNGLIAFASNGSHSVNSEIYAFSLDGRPTNISRSPAVDTQPQPSPDGAKLAFVSDRSGSRALYIANADGSHAREVLDRAANVTWSPDG